MQEVKEMAERLIGAGFTAGEGYGEVWIRDFNTFMEVACEVNDHQVIKEHLLTFFKFQQEDGQIIDGYIPADKAAGGYRYIYTDLAPAYAGHKNSVETDQESSLIQAVARYIHSTGDAAILREEIGGIPVQERMARAMQYLLDHRYDDEYGLIWGATTADWGDVQPEHEWGVELDSSSHKAIDVYDNAMFMVAVQDYLSVAELEEKEVSYWKDIRGALRKNIKTHLWEQQRKKFIPHIYLGPSPFPESFNEDEIYYHGGTAVAIEAGLLSPEEVKDAYHKMKENVEKSGAASIGLTMYPVYPEGFFKNKGMRPYSYQNGGDWTWFGGRMVTQLIRYGFMEDAKEALQPMLERVVKNNDFYEWYSRDNKPQGSAGFRGSAGVLWTAISALQKAEH